MAYNISNFDGTVIAPGGAYPYGDVKDAPSGTRVNKKMVTDILQTSQIIMADGLNGVAVNGLPDNATNGYQLYTALKRVTVSEYSIQSRGSMDGDTIDFKNNQTIIYTATSTNVTLTIDFQFARAGNKVVLRTNLTGGGVLTVNFTNTGGNTPTSISFSNMAIGAFSGAAFEFEYSGLISGLLYFTERLFGF
jgi:hypothetical protein